MKQHHETKCSYHDQQPGVQAAFLKEDKALVTVLDKMGNPLLEHSEDLLVIDTRDIVDAEVAETVRKIETLGEEQYIEFVTERLEQCETPITGTIPENKLPLFSRPPVKVQPKQKAQLAALKSDCGLFSRLYISCQTSDGDIDTFFAHENQSAPPALSIAGKMQSGVKADLLRCLEADLPEQNGVPVVDATIFDGAALVQMLNPGTSNLFKNLVKECLHRTSLPNSRRVTASTLSGMYTYLQASRPPPSRRGGKEPGKGSLHPLHLHCNA